GRTLELVSTGRRRTRPYCVGESSVAVASRSRNVQGPSLRRGAGQLQAAIWKVSGSAALGYTRLLEQLISRDPDRKRDSGIGCLCPDVGYIALASGSRASHPCRVSDTRYRRCLPHDDADLFRVLDFAGERIPLLAEEGNAPLTRGAGTERAFWDACA